MKILIPSRSISICWRPSIATTWDLIKPKCQRFYYQCLWIYICHFSSLTMMSNIFLTMVLLTPWTFWPSFGDLYPSYKWRVIVQKLPKYMKLVEIAMVQVVGNIESKRCLNNLNQSSTMDWQWISDLVGKPPIWHVKENSIPMCTCNLERYVSSIWPWKLFNHIKILC
jgi:hypothetical protein